MNPLRTWNALMNAEIALRVSIAPYLLLSLFACGGGSTPPAAKPAPVTDVVGSSDIGGYYGFRVVMPMPGTL